LPESRPAAEASSSATGVEAHTQGIAMRIAASAVVVQGLHARHPDGNSVRPSRHGRPKLSLIMTGIGV